jgi:hypothetical protein
MKHGTYREHGFGDADDLRFRDTPGVIVGLKAKGRGRGDLSGFVVRLAA